MKRFNDLKIGTRLIISFVLIVIFTGVIGAVGIVNIKKIQSEGQEMYEQNTKTIEALSEINLNYQRLRISLRDIVFTNDVTKKSEYANTIKDLQSKISEDANKANDKLTRDDEKAQYEKFKSNFTSYQEIITQIVNASLSNDIKKATELIYQGNGLQIATDIKDSIDKTIEINSKLALEKSIENQATANNSIKIMIIILGALVVISLVLSIVVSRSISAPIKKLTGFSRKLAIGDVDLQIDISSKDEIGELSKAFQSITYNIKEQVNAADNIAAGDLSANIKVNSEKDVLGKKLNEMKDTISNLINETGRLTNAAELGALDTRGEAGKFTGAWKDLVQGFNNILDAVIEPVEEAAEVLEEISKGNFEIKVKGDYKGDHAKIKNAMNDTITEIKSYINEISTVLLEMSKGNLNLEITRDYRGEFIDVKNSINNILKAFNETLGEINISAEQVASAAEQVSETSQVLSEASTEQASSVEEITASMEEVGAQTKINAEHANNANRITKITSDKANKGVEQMKEMLNAMEKINESSANISKIIKVIDEIAFQTNILALNAAVEAARAGQHGKGFAVVAEEVRNLAARSANAAKETTQMIEESIKKADSGKEIANDTAKALNDIVENINEASGIVAEIAAASNEQSDALEQVSRAIQEVAGVTQGNSATAEESASASEELTAQASLLKNRVARFKLKM
ncbi:methyl-accepting chemotaxis protein IV [Clostridium homopropionicum DSM 5847]|uniref:Methyl-accepting chemotaxis protein IV n=1 Tax=Clostridium homopropionicum DSM 5847 TaxID=1121318 RepID=A0A0L6Z5C2_9CLOT|nr:methyl-accepting chemotaxis protein [Clostridium homopropionicum]KOA18156.1 methyl-accepting chemotaxis protein IV [Clostridium homopropionicum DSM 5847]SFG94870.1 methyl-accepting chemotaxis protein [Clostridium homopropionicum]